jgi:glutamate synthase (NADPH/NADH) large chain
MVSLDKRADRRRAEAGVRTKLHGDQTDEAQLKKLLEDHNRWTGSRARASCWTLGRARTSS